MKEENSEKNLVQNLKSGDYQAFDQLFQQYHKRVYFFAKGYLKVTEDAEELVQECFVKVWEFRSRINGDLSFSGYLFTIIRNLFINKYYKKIQEVAYQKKIVRYIQKYNQNTEEEIIHADLEGYLHRLIEQLPPQRKKIFYMSRIDGLSHKEISEKLAISCKTIENQITEAIKFIRQKIGKEDFLLAAFLYYFLTHHIN